MWYPGTSGLTLGISHVGICLETEIEMEDTGKKKKER